MVSLNVPIDMIAMCNSLGEMIPIKFRIEDESHHMLTIRVDEVIYQKESQYAGSKTLEYGCRALLEDRQQLIEVRYHIATHRWTIKKVIC